GIGRIRRNPKLLNYENLTQESKELVTKAYAWGLKPPSEIKETKLQSKQIQSDLKIKTVSLKADLKKQSFDITAFLSQPDKIKTFGFESIFELNRKLEKSSPEVQNLYNSYVTDSKTWFHFMNNIDSIIKENNKVMTSFANFEITKDAAGKITEFSLPCLSYFSETNFEDN
ncbi:MAG: hypothetical protein KBT47_07235, partial [Armatimonadetes bacterium]|nr:hypothetical protein [Candidatus Hippobium faecium]